MPMSEDTSVLELEAMQRQQEMRQNEMANKIFHKPRTEVLVDKIPESDDEYDLFDDHNTAALQSLRALDLTVTPRPKTLSSVKITAPDDMIRLNKAFQHLRKDYEDARGELKVVNRENRDQSLELRELKKTNSASQERINHLRQQNAQLRETIRASGEKLSKSEKSKYHEHLEYLEEHISHLHHERQKREAHMEFLTEQTREANEEKASIESESRKLQRQVRDLSTNLTECKDDLLRLQPTSQISDKEISDQYSNLDQQISGWVDDKTEDTQILEDQIDKIQTVEDLPDLLRKCLSSDHLKMAKKYPDSQPILIRHLIHRLLGSFVFDDDIYLFGLDSRNIALLKGLEDGMKLLEPRRDAITLRRWRSETLQSLLQMAYFIEEQERQAQLLSQTLFSALSHLISDSPPTEQDWQDLHIQVILPAIQLSTKLRLSTADYKLTSHIFHRDPTQAATVFMYEIKNSCMIDITTHKILRPDSVLKVAPDGRIGGEKLVVSPALLRVHSDGRGRVLVCKPTLLVKLDEPMGKRGRGIKALGAWTPSWFGSDDAAV